MTIPSIVHSERVPTEYDVVAAPLGRIGLSDDRGRVFTGWTLRSAFRRAERAQNPLDPIHHPPFPSPSEVSTP